MFFPKIPSGLDSHRKPESSHGHQVDILDTPPRKSWFRCPHGSARLQGQLRCYPAHSKIRSLLKRLFSGKMPASTAVTRCTTLLQKGSDHMYVFDAVRVEVWQPHRQERSSSRLLFIVEAIRELRDDENFANMLRAESLDSIPAFLEQRIADGTPT